MAMGSTPGWRVNARPISPNAVTTSISPGVHFRMLFVGYLEDSPAERAIAKMKDGTTHLAYKSEHAVDLATGVMLGLGIYPADQGDTTCITEPLAVVEENLAALGDTPPELLCMVTDKGYHNLKI